MIITIEFNGEFQSRTIKIEYVLADAILSSELKSTDFLAF